MSCAKLCQINLRQSNALCLNGTICAKTSRSWQRTQSRNLAIMSWLYRTTAAAEEGNFACRHFSLNAAAAAELQTNSSTTPERKTFGANCFSQNISQFGRRRSRTDTFQRKFGKARLHAHVVSAWLLKGLPSSLLILRRALLL